MLIKTVMIRVGVIGYGYWGPNLVRNFMEAQGSTVVAVCDLNPERLAMVQNRYPSIRTLTNWRELLSDPDIDAVAVATPVSSHFELAMAALAANKHVLVENPWRQPEQALQLIDEAARRQRVLMVDHTFVYTVAKFANSLPAMLRRDSLL